MDGSGLLKMQATPEVTVIWLKRDIRLCDHACFHYASQAPYPIVVLYVEEPLVIYSPSFSQQHAGFLAESLASLQKQLATQGVTLFTAKGHVLEVLETLQHYASVQAIHSHEETGEWATYERDVLVSHWCKAQGIAWHEHRQFGVIRRLKHRSTWAERWKVLMEQPAYPVPERLQSLPAQALPMYFQHPVFQGEFPYAGVHHLRQTGGTEQAMAVLESFLESRGKEYSKHMSSPNLAEEGCTRLSPYITFGCISMRTVYQRIIQAQKDVWNRYPKAEAKGWFRSLRSAESRLYWHCHFIQKLERKPRLEFEALHYAYEGLRPHTPEAEKRFRAFQQAETGIPMIDACLRYLFAHGWINFRMRALLMSFGCYQLWLPWQWVGSFLAAHFIDYEPGIHFYQSQMQSASTGFNTVRIYCPIKQAKDQDPKGEFIARWVPELADLPLPYRYSPWELPPLLAQSMGFQPGEHYPHPIVDLKTSYDEAKQQVFELRHRFPPRFNASANPQFRRRR
jgi:deoxyribodipyrimidine photo-lyase